MIGVALFDLLPEALETGRRAYAPLAITTATGVGFATYLVLDRLPQLLSAGAARRNRLGPGSLTAHSLMDGFGFGIGVAFQASTAVGWVVALAVLAHDFLDGANTVTLSLDGDASKGRRAAGSSLMLSPRSLGSAYLGSSTLREACSAFFLVFSADHSSILERASSCRAARTADHD